MGEREIESDEIAAAVRGVFQEILSIEASGSWHAVLS